MVSLPPALNLLNLLGASPEPAAGRAVSASQEEPNVQFQSVLAMFLQTLNVPAPAAQQPAKAAGTQPESDTDLTEADLGPNGLGAESTPALELTRSIADTVALLQAQSRMGTQAEAPKPSDASDAAAPIDNRIPQVSEQAMLQAATAGSAQVPTALSQDNAMPTEAASTATAAAAVASLPVQAAGTRKDARSAGSPVPSGEETPAAGEAQNQPILPLSATPALAVAPDGKEAKSATVPGKPAVSQPQPAAAKPELSLHAKPPVAEPDAAPNKPEPLKAPSAPQNTVHTAQSAVIAPLPDPPAAAPIDSNTMQVALPAGGIQAASGQAYFANVSHGDNSANPAVASFRPLVNTASAMIEDLRGRVVARPAVRQATLRLDPPSLGRVEITLHLDANNHVRAIVAAQDPAATQHLNSHLETLRASLADAGIQFDQFGSNSQQRNDQQAALFGGQPGNSNNQGSAQGNNGREGLSQEAEESIDSTTPAASQPSRQLDLTV